MRVLTLQPAGQDYLADALLHGLRSVLGDDCVDVPRADRLYATLPAADRAALRGRGFTLYGLLPDRPDLAAARARWADDIGGYDLVVVPSVWRQRPLLAHPAVRSAWRRVVLLDGEDFPAVFPYSKALARAPAAFLAGRGGRPYFKREWFRDGHDYGGLTGWLPGPVRRRLPGVRECRPVSFAIPAEKVCDFDRLDKAKDFPRHLVDPELARSQAGAFFSAVGADTYTFDTEADYYADLRASRFGATVKRGGWDCLRHYELAANGCVLCFRDLDRKPATCAPHGLTADNCVSYRSADDLARRLKGVSPGEYQGLLAGTRDWIGRNTTAALARRFLAAAAAARPAP